jgi:hypothetical protein
MVPLTLVSTGMSRFADALGITCLFCTGTASSPLHYVNLLWVVWLVTGTSLTATLNFNSKSILKNHSREHSGFIRDLLPLEH